MRLPLLMKESMAKLVYMDFVSCFSKDVKCLFCEGGHMLLSVTLESGYRNVTTKLSSFLSGSSVWRAFMYVLRVKLFLPVVLLQLVSGIKYTMKVEIARTTCTKATADPQSCSLYDTPEMAKVGSRAEGVAPWVFDAFSSVGVLQGGMGSVTCLPLRKSDVSLLGWMR